jgi:hypothetical protein
MKSGKERRRDLLGKRDNIRKAALVRLFWLCIIINESNFLWRLGQKSLNKYFGNTCYIKLYARYECHAETYQLARLSMNLQSLWGKGT